MEIIRETIPGEITSGELICHYELKPQVNYIAPIGKSVTIQGELKYSKIDTPTNIRYDGIIPSS